MKSPFIPISHMFLFKNWRFFELGGTQDQDLGASAQFFGQQTGADQAG